MYEIYIIIICINIKSEICNSFKVRVTDINFKSA